ncbi:MAG: hypothetical protein JWM53_5675 [bacterium]|nr:hypothetical protein [bacterium]
MKRMLLTAMLMLGAAPAFAQPSTGTTATISPELRQKLQATRSRYKDQMKPLWQDARAARQALGAEMQKAQPDDGALTQLEDRLAGDRQKMQALHASQQAELRKQLTPRELAQLMLSHKGFGRHMHGGGHDGGGDGQ